MQKIKALTVSLLLLLVCVAAMGQGKVGLYIGAESIDQLTSDDEKAAATWFSSTYSDGVIITPSTLSKIDQVTTLWVGVDRKLGGPGWLNLPSEFNNENLREAIKKHVKAGGTLLLTNLATQLVSWTGRIGEKYAPNLLGYGDAVWNGDVWGSQPVIGNREGQIYDRSNHPAYSGMTLTPASPRSIYCFTSQGMKGDHNSMWDLNKDYDLAESPNRVKAWEDLTNSQVIGTWNQVEDYCCAGIVDFAPTTDYPGRILCVGLAAYEWSLDGAANLYQSELEKFTSNSIAYLRAAATKTVDGGGEQGGGDDPSGDDVTPGSDVTTVGMFIGYNSINDIADDDEKAAAQWFAANYPQGTIYTPATISTLNTTSTKVLWVMVDRTGLQAGWQNLPDAFKSTTAINALTAYVKAGGNMLLSNHATQLLCGIGRLSSAYAPNVFGAGDGSNNPDVWGYNANIGGTYDHRSHAIFNGLSTGEHGYGYNIIPLIGNGWKEDHNCMWQLTTMGLSDNPNLVKDFENKTNSTVLGTWQQITNFEFAGLVEFKPQDAYRGNIIANGAGAYEWKQNSGTNAFQSNVEKMTKNTLEYLLTLEPGDEPTPDPTPDPTPSSPEETVAMFIGFNSINEIADDDEKAAAQWFAATYPKGTVYTPATISTLNTTSTKVLWVMVDRVGIGSGWNSLPDAFKSTTAISALKDYVKAGGNVLLTNHATQLLCGIGRLSSAYAPNVFGSGDGSNNADVWGYNANVGGTYDHRSHAIFNGLSTGEHGYGYNIIPLIGNGWKEDHNCMWQLTTMGLSDNPNTVKDFENKTNSTVLGTWQQITNFDFAGIIEFKPLKAYRGNIIANGVAAYEWKQNSGTNEFQSNVEKLTKNTIEYLLTLEPGEEWIEPEPSGDADAVVQFDMTAQGGSITELCSGNTFHVEGVHGAENISGAVGKALRLDGYSSFVNASIDASQLSSSLLTVSAWMAPETYPIMRGKDGVDNSFMTVAGNLTDNGGFAFMLSAQGDYGFTCFAGGRIELRANHKLPCYEWSHLVATIDAVGGSVKLYRNGELVAEGSCGGDINVGGNNFLIGKSREDIREGDCYLNTFNGLIDDITIYNKVMTAEEAALPVAANEANLTVPESRFANDIMRPQYHAMPQANWGNETHGAVYYNGKFHVFYQKNANGPYWGRLHWGHIYSTDMYRWYEDQTALRPDHDYDAKGCWSGCVFDYNGTPNILYTGVDTEKAVIAMARPNDNNLQKWTKNSNLVLPGRPGGLDADFRDPNCYKVGNNYFFIVGAGKNNIGVATLHRFNPATGEATNDGAICFRGSDQGANGTYWEMPNLTDMGNGKWLFTCTPLGPQQGVETHYWIGTVNNDGYFTPTSSAANQPSKLDLDGMSKDGYGLLSPTIFKHEGKTLLLGIVPDKLGLGDNYRLGWAHVFSLPREVSVSADGKTLLQKPYSGLTGMRTKTKFEKTGFDLNGTQSLSPVNGRKFEVCGEFQVGNSEFGYRFYKNGDRYARLYYTPGNNTLTLDINGIDRIVQDNPFGGVYSSQLPEKPGTLKLHMFVDHSILDVFINDTWAFSVRLFPNDSNANGVEAYSNGSTRVNSLSAWNLDEKEDIPTIQQFTKDGVDYEVNIDDSTGKVVKGGSSLTAFDLADGVVEYQPQGSTLPRDFTINSINEGAFSSCDLLSYADLTGYVGTVNNPRSTFPANTLLYVNGSKQTLTGNGTVENVVKVGGSNSVCEKLTVYDLKPFANKYAFTANEVSYTRDYTNSLGETTTLALPFAIDATVAESFGDFYKFTKYESDALTFDQEDNGTEAYKPYVFMPKAGGISMSTPVVVPAMTSTTVADGTTDVQFVAAYTNFEFSPANNYQGKYSIYGAQSGSEFNFVTTAGKLTVQPLRAYIQLGFTGSAEVKKVNLITGIDDVVVNPTSSYVIYDLQGRKVGVMKDGVAPQLRRGVYIIGGKKILINK